MGGIQAVRQFWKANAINDTNYARWLRTRATIMFELEATFTACCVIFLPSYGKQM